MPSPLSLEVLPRPPAAYLALAALSPPGKLHLTQLLASSGAWNTAETARLAAPLYRVHLLAKLLFYLHLILTTQ